MTTCTIQTTGKALLAAMQYRAKEDVRRSLEGVFVEASASTTRLTATDGHILGIFQESHANDVDGKVSFAIPNEVLGRLKVPARQIDEPLTITLKHNDGDAKALKRKGHLRTADGTVFSFVEVEGRYPSYTQVIPRHEYSSQVANTQLDPALIVRVYKAAHIWTGIKRAPYRLVYGDTDLTALRIEVPETKGGRFIGVISPMSCGASSGTKWSSDYEWARQPVHAAEQLAPVNIGEG